MSWSFLNIFKKADFNTLMFSIAVTGWILFFIYPENIYILMAAILCSTYCVSRLIIYSFKSYWKKKKGETNRRNEEKQEKLDQRLEAQYVYDRLSEENKELFFSIINTSTKSVYSNVYILHGDQSRYPILSQLKHLLYSDKLIASWVIVDMTKECVSISIKYPLNEIFESNCK